MKKNILRRMCETGVIAALYTVLTLVIPAASFGPLQLRLSELLTILPVFTPAAIPGLTLGCLFSNTIGLSMGTNLAGAWDLVFGTLATLVSALCTYFLRNVTIRNIPVLAALPATIFNSLIVGTELNILLFQMEKHTWFLCVAEVGVGELIVATVGGLVVYFMLEETGAAKHIFRGGIHS